MRCFLASFVAFLLSCPAVCPAQDSVGSLVPGQPYAVLVSIGTSSDTGWKRAVDALGKRYGARIFTFDYPDLWAVQDAVAAYAPRYVCIVARPSEATRGFIKEAGGFVRTLDDDPYEDAIWAVLTGFDADDALRIATAEPLEVSRGISHVGGGWLEWMEEGVSWSEGVKNQKSVKAKGEAARQAAGPDDTTHEMAGELNRGRHQIMSSSGHATERDWQLGYSYPDGKFVSRGGKLFAIARDGKEMEIVSPDPKLYMSCGNCLIAHAIDMDSMVLAWIHSGGANQFFGHLEVQYRTCWAWDVANYFLTLQGRFTFAECVSLFHQDVTARLQDNPNDEQRFLLTSDQEGTALYGDPAWQARLKPSVEPVYDQTLAVSESGGGITLVFTVKAVKECAPSEPAGAFLPFRITDATVTRTDAAGVVVADDFVLLRLLREGDAPLKPGDTRSVTIRARKADGLKRSLRIPGRADRVAAAPVNDLAAASGESRPIVGVMKAAGKGPAPAIGADDGKGAWKPSGEGIVHVGSDGREDASLAFPGRRIGACAWDGKYLWLAEKGLLHVVARDEILFSIPLPEMEDPASIAIDRDGGRVRGSGGDEVTFRIDRSIAQTLGPKTRAFLDLTAVLLDQGMAGMDVADLSLAIPWDSNRQKVIGEIAFSEPARVNTDRWGQRFASFRGLSIAPNAPFRRTVSWTAEMQDARMWIWPERVGPREAIPKPIRDMYTVDGSVLCLMTEEVKRAAAEAVGDERETYWMARSIYRYVTDHMRFERGRGWPTVPELLKDGTGTCSGFAYMFVALCRANGLPARFAAGTRCREGNPSVDREFHRWAEVYLPGYGWVPVDASAVDTKDPASRAANFGHVAGTDFVITVGGGDSEFLGWDYNANGSTKVTSYQGHEARIGMGKEVAWAVPGAAGTDAPRDGLFNGDFEAGLDGWRVEGPHVTGPANDATRPGTCLHIHVNPGASCRMDVPGHPELWEKTYRKVRLPADASFLHFWARVVGQAYHEPVSVFVDAGTGPQPVFAAGDGGGTGEEMAWTELFADVSAYRGMTVLLGFYAANPNGYSDHVTDILVDDVFLCDGDRKRIDVPQPEVKPPDAALDARIDDSVRKLADPSAAERRKGLEALAGIGPGARARLQAAAADENAALRVGARSALAALEDLDFRLLDEERAKNSATKAR